MPFSAEEARQIHKHFCLSFPLLPTLWLTVPPKSHSAKTQPDVVMVQRLGQGITVAPPVQSFSPLVPRDPALSLSALSTCPFLFYLFYKAG